MEQTSTGRGRPKKTDNKSVLDAIVMHKEEIMSSWKEGKFPPRSSNLWKNIAFVSNTGISPLGVCTIVSKNYHNIWDLLEIHRREEILDVEHALEPIVENEVTVSEKYDDSGSHASSSSSRDELCINKEFTFMLSRDEYRQMSPTNVTYVSKDKTNPHRSVRSHSIFQPRTWSHIINSHFFQHLKLPCTLVFKTAKISKTSEPFANIRAYCKECASKFHGEIFTEPLADSRVMIKCVYSGNFNVPHSLESKRHLSGLAKHDAISKMKNENLSASMYRRLEAHKTMTFTGHEPSALPTTNVLRVAKHKYAKAEELDEDPILALCNAQDVVPYQGTIRDVGYRKFFVHYWSPSQLHVYRAYCKSSQNPTISIDATGSVVRRLRRPVKRKSGHIFLYEVTVNDKKAHKQYSVCNMLSERHDANSIYYWLAEWIRSGATIPSEVVTDMSAALMSAAVKAFTQFSSLSEYVEECANILIPESTRPTMRIPNCIIRCDVAHTVKLISSWKSLHGLPGKRTRQFYLRSMGQVVQCDSILDMKELLTAILTVAQYETEGDSIVGEPTKCKKMKAILQRRIACGLRDEIQTAVSDAENPDNAVAEREVPPDVTAVNQSSDVNVTQSKSFQVWVKALAAQCEPDVDADDDDGDIGNQQYLPSIVKDIVHLSKLLPLWTAVMRPIFKYPHRTASSAPVEGSFNDLKHRVFQNLPIKADRFVFTHIKAIDGQMKLAASPILPSGQEQFHSQIVQDTAMTDANTSFNKRTSLNKTNQSKTVSAHPEMQNQTKCKECLDVEPVEGEEGYGEIRLCYACSSNQTAPTLTIASERDDILDNECDGVPESYPSTDITTAMELVQPLSRSEIQNQTKCPACIDGLLPDGAHLCIMCHVAVHPFPQCSLPVVGEEEGYGERRLCYPCSSNQTATILTIASERDDILDNECDGVPESYPSTDITTAMELVQPLSRSEIQYQTKCPACIDGLLPDGAHLCIMCHVAVHPFSECSLPVEEEDEGYGVRRLCYPCSSKSPQKRRSVSELNLFENWRNKGIPYKKRLRKSYLEPNSEWLLVNLSQARPVLPIGLLKNGHRLKPITFDQTSYHLANTCGLDTIIQLCCIAYCDSLEMKTLIDDSTLPIFQLCANVMKNGVRQKAYRLRALILKEHYPVDQLPGGLKRIDCLDSSAEVLKKVLTSNPSVTETGICNSNKCPQKERYVNQPILSIDISAGVISCLEELVLKELNTEYCNECKAKIECIIGMSSSDYVLTPDTGLMQCSGYRTRSLALSDVHFFIELYHSIDIDMVTSVMLETIPINLNIYNKVFWLRGVCGYAGTVKEGSAGHYVTYTRRHDNHWEAYDDLQDKKENVSPQKIVTISLLYFTVA